MGASPFMDVETSQMRSHLSKKVFAQRPLHMSSTFINEMSEKLDVLNKQHNVETSPWTLKIQGEAHHPIATILLEAGLQYLHFCAGIHSYFFRSTDINTAISYIRDILYNKYVQPFTFIYLTHAF